MTNNVGMTQTAYIAPQKVNGKTHRRENELASYRETLNNACDQLCRAAEERDFEACDYFHKIIDKAQENINNIIAQEDNHYYKTSDISMEKMDKIVDTADKTVDITEKGVSNFEKHTMPGKLLNCIA